MAKLANPHGRTDSIVFSNKLVINKKYLSTINTILTNKVCTRFYLKTRLIDIKDSHLIQSRLRMIFYIDQKDTGAPLILKHCSNILFNLHSEIIHNIDESTAEYAECDMSLLKDTNSGWYVIENLRRK